MATEFPPASSDCDGRRWYLLLGTRTTDGAGRIPDKESNVDDFPMDPTRLAVKLPRNLWESPTTRLIEFVPTRECSLEFDAKLKKAC